MKKISLMLVFVMLLAVVLAFSVFAIDARKVTVNDVTFASTGFATGGNPSILFDGKTACSGYYGWSNAEYYCKPGAGTLTFEFESVVKITSLTIYANGNWAPVQVTVYDGEDNAVHQSTQNVSIGENETGTFKYFSDGAFECKKVVISQAATNKIIRISEVEMTAHFHNYETEEKAPTCTEPGYTKYTCSCGDTKTEEIPATGNHSYTEFVAYVEGKEPTCAVVGEATYKCATCDGTEVKPVDATGEHNYSEFVAYVEGKEPTCAVAGEATYKCATCDGTQVNGVEATGNHSYTEFVAYVEGKEPTCGAAGEATYKCATCDGTEVKPVDATGDHKYTEFVGVKYPNGFLAEGVKEYACVCEATTSEAAPAIFEFLGYSVKEDDSEICAGYTVNREALELYEEMNETTVKFGVVAAGYDNLVNADGKPINADGTTAEVTKGAVIAVGFENDIYTSFTIRMVADDWTAVADAKIILGAYVIDGDVVSYICSDVATEAAAPITYNSINGGNN